MNRLLAAALCLWVTAETAQAAVYSYSIKSKPLKCVQPREDLDDCSPKKMEPVKFSFAIDEDYLVPGPGYGMEAPNGTLENAWMVWEGGLHEEPGYELPKWLISEDLEWIHEVFESDFWLTTGPNREIISLNATFIEVGESGWNINQYGPKGPAYVQYVDGCEEPWECQIWEGKTKADKLTLVESATPVPVPPAAVLLLSGLVGMFWLKRRT